MMQLYECLESPYSRLAKDDPQGHLDQQGDLEKEILSLIFEEQRSDSLNANLAAPRVRRPRCATAFRATCCASSASWAALPGASDRVAWGYVSASGRAGGPE